MTWWLGCGEICFISSFLIYLFIIYYVIFSLVWGTTTPVDQLKAGPSLHPSHSFRSFDSYSVLISVFNGFIWLLPWLFFFHRRFCLFALLCSFGGGRVQVHEQFYFILFVFSFDFLRWFKFALLVFLNFFYSFFRSEMKTEIRLILRWPWLFFEWVEILSSLSPLGSTALEGDTIGSYHWDVLAL